MKFDCKGTQTNNCLLNDFVAMLESIKDNSLWNYKGLQVEIDPTIDYSDNNVLIRWKDINEGFNDKIIYYNLAEFKKDFDATDFKNTEMLESLIKYHDSTIASLLELKEKYQEEKRQLEKQLAKQKVQNAAGSIDELISSAKDVSGIKLVTGEFTVDNTDELKELGDKLREKMGSAVGLLYSVIDGKVGLCAVVSDDLVKTKKLSAGKIAGDVAKILGGGGGGKPHLATAGGKDVSKIGEALDALPQIIQKYL